MDGGGGSAQFVQCQYFESSFNINCTVELTTILESPYFVMPFMIFRIIISSSLSPSPAPKAMTSPTFHNELGSVFTRFFVVTIFVILSVIILIMIVVITIVNIIMLSLFSSSFLFRSLSGFWMLSLSLPLSSLSLHHNHDEMK